VATRATRSGVHRAGAAEGAPARSTAWVNVPSSRGQSR
jgi:hypothetical protein